MSSWLSRFLVFDVSRPGLLVILPTRLGYTSTCTSHPTKMFFFLSVTRFKTIGCGFAAPASYAHTRTGREPLSGCSVMRWLPCHSAAANTVARVGELMARRGCKRSSRQEVLTLRGVCIARLGTCSTSRHRHGAASSAGRRRLVRPCPG